MKLLLCICLVLSLAVWCEAKAWPRAFPQNNALSFLEGVAAGEVIEAEQQVGGYGGYGGFNNGYGGYNNGYGYGNGYGYNYGR